MSDAIAPSASAVSPKKLDQRVRFKVGLQETLVGTGNDDDSDALDRRVEFKVIEPACCKPT